MYSIPLTVLLLTHCVETNVFKLLKCDYSITIFLAEQNLFAKIIKFTKKNHFMTNLRVTDVIFELNYFKAKISAYLKRHCCHSNDSCLTFVKKIQALQTVFYISVIFFVFQKVTDLNRKFSIFFKKLC